MVNPGKTIEQKPATQKKINPEAPNSVEKSKADSQIKSAQKATAENHSGASNIFSHANSNRGK